MVIKFTMMMARNISSSKSGLQPYSSMYFIGLVSDTPSPRKFQILAPEPKPCCHAVINPLPNKHPLVHASSTIATGIHLVEAAVAVTDSSFTLMTQSDTSNVASKPKNGRKPIALRGQLSVMSRCLTSSMQSQPH